MILEIQYGFKWQSHNTFKPTNIISKYWQHHSKLTISFQNTDKCVPDKKICRSDVGILRV